MARSFNNALLQGVRGAIGEIVIKQYSYGTVISKKPDMGKVKKTALQKVKQNKFKDAVKYAQGIVHNKQRKAAYAKKLPPGTSVFNAAISAYLQEQQIR